jgi:hypothetical protein
MAEYTAFQLSHYPSSTSGHSLDTQDEHEALNKKFPLVVCERPSKTPKNYIHCNTLMRVRI